jgi:uncharacterized protein YebE (UPF0316 family)
LIVYIFVAELAVVTLSTLRTICIARGMKYSAPTLGFFEICLWLSAIKCVMQNLDDARCALAFAAGFTLGNYLGLLVEQALALGSVVVRCVTPRDAAALIDGLKAARYGVTSLPGQGANGPVTVILTVVPRRDLPAVVALLEEFDPDLFYSVEALQTAASGVSPGKAGFPSVPRLAGVTR